MQSARDDGLLIGDEVGRSSGVVEEGEEELIADKVMGSKSGRCVGFESWSVEHGVKPMGVMQGYF